MGGAHGSQDRVLVYLDHLSLMHGDTVVRVLGELVQSTGSCSVNQWV